MSSEGRVPERDFEIRLMEVTKDLVVSQLTLVQSQKCAVDDQPDGVGDNKERRFDMTSASSAEEKEKNTRWRKKKVVAAAILGFLGG